MGLSIIILFAVSFKLVVLAVLYRMTLTFVAQSVSHCLDEFSFLLRKCYMSANFLVSMQTLIEFLE